MAPRRATASAPGKLILFGEHAVVHGATALAGALSDLRASTSAEATADALVTVSVPDLGALAAGVPRDGVPSCVHSWTMEQLAAGLAPVLAAARAPAAGDYSLRPPAVRPTPEVVAALEALAAECPDEPARKALAPVLFLACGILFEQLFGGGGGVGGGGGGGGVGGLRVTVHVPSLPVAAGLGSSAAFAVSTAGALLDVRAQCDGGGLAGGGGGGGGGWRRACDSWLACVNAWAYSCEMLFHGAPSGLDNTVAT